MPRTDLLSLTFDDLVTLTNRGTVKRAQREVESGEYSCDLSEDQAGSLKVGWSDGVECQLPSDKALRDGQCTCAAVTLCRHLVRTVLAYQQHHAGGAEEESSDEDAPLASHQQTEPWDPGTISDEELSKHYRSPVFSRIRRQFEQGVLVELVRSSKPSARFHLQACLVRFLVPGDPRYTHCDCDETAPCSHVPLAVWSFRQLAPDQQAGLLSLGTQASAAPVELLDELQEAFLDFTEYGVSGAPAIWNDRIARLEERCRKADLVWPAEVLSELAQQQERYANHDALFAPERVAELVGELLIRSDAIRNDTGVLPQLLIRGARADRTVTLGAARFVGLGCGVRLRRRRVELTAYLQDTDTGTVVAVRRESSDNQDDPARPLRAFGELASAPAIKGSSFANLGAGQLLIRGARRSASYHLIPGRAQASVQPQAFTWENLRPPVLVEEFAELDARLSTLPPASLRPRRVAEDFHVCSIAGVESAHFDSTTQAVRAILLDPRGQSAYLMYPFTSRSEPGTEALLHLLTTSPQAIRFVSGPVRRTAGGLEIHPVCLVWEEGNTRRALQPWIEQRAPAASTHLSPEAMARTSDPLRDYLRQFQESLGELLVLGLQRADSQVARRWNELQLQGEGVGFARLASRLRALAESLAQKAHTIQWDWRQAGLALLELAAMVRMTQDLTGETED